MEDLKKRVGYQAAEYVENGMTVGLGTGSTAYYLIEALGKKVQAGDLKIKGVATSQASKDQAESYGIEVVDVDDVDRIHVTIDGADEIDLNLQGIKGGGGALLYEKIVAKNSDSVIWIVDQSKMVETLGAFPLPVEVVRYGSGSLLKHFESLGYRPTLREKDGRAFVTQNGNFIIDLHLDLIQDPHRLSMELNETVGVIIHGLFLDMADRVLVGTETGVDVYEAKGGQAH